MIVSVYVVVKYRVFVIVSLSVPGNVIVAVDVGMELVMVLEPP